MVKKGTKGVKNEGFLEFQKGALMAPMCRYARLRTWGYEHKHVNHGRGEFARDEDGDGFCEMHVNTMEGFVRSVDRKRTQVLGQIARC
jgi:hypothetical protein